MRRNVDRRIKKALAKNHACYVLITCDEPSADGEMAVEMSYEGNATIAACLLRDAQSFIDEDADELDALAHEL